MARAFLIFLPLLLVGCANDAGTTTALRPLQDSAPLLSLDPGVPYNGCILTQRIAMPEIASDPATSSGCTVSYGTLLGSPARTARQ